MSITVDERIRGMQGAREKLEANVEATSRRAAEKLTAETEAAKRLQDALRAENDQLRRAAGEITRELENAKNDFARRASDAQREYEQLVAESHAAAEYARETELELDSRLASTTKELEQLRRNFTAKEGKADQLERALISEKEHFEELLAAKANSISQLLAKIDELQSRHSAAVAKVKTALANFKAAAMTEASIEAQGKVLKMQEGVWSAWSDTILDPLKDDRKAAKAGAEAAIKKAREVQQTDEGIILSALEGEAEGGGAGAASGLTRRKALGQQGGFRPQ
jgi:chromosome segregation ATPase